MFNCDLVIVYILLYLMYLNSRNLSVIPPHKMVPNRVEVEPVYRSIGVFISVISWSWKLCVSCNIFAFAQTLKISHRANLVIYALTAQGQTCFVATDRHSQTPSSRNKKCQLALGKVTVEKRFGQEPVADPLPPWMLSLALMPQQKPASDENDRSVSAANDSKSSQNSCQGWKSYVHICCERREGKKAQWMRGGGLTLLWRIVQGFVVWKAWEERGGALTGSLWAGESRINCNCHGCQWGFVCSSRWNGGFEFNS